MARHLVPLVIAGAAGCVPDAPRELRVERRFTDEEIALLAGGIDTANAELGGLLGGDVIELGPTFTDPDGFHFDDFGDEVHGLYTLDRASAEYAWLRDAGGHDDDGYATLGDVIVIRRVPPGASDRDRRCFVSVELHELGHFLGMTHNPDPNSVMHPGGSACPIDYTGADLAMFCIDFACR
jgi:hypothetical protein